MNYTVTSKMRECREGAYVDYIASGYIIKNGDRIPCNVGFTDYSEGITATHLFINRAGITEKGNHYYPETIEITAYDKEVTE